VLALARAPSSQSPWSIDMVWLYDGVVKARLARIHRFHGASD
jgi:hypothetical protein